MPLHDALDASTAKLLARSASWELRGDYWDRDRDNGDCAVAEPAGGVLPVRGQKKLGSALILRFVQLSRKPSTSAWLHRAGKPIFDMTVIMRDADAALPKCQ